MNNYRAQDYYNYVNNNYNQPLYQQGFNNGSNVFDAYRGFISGNMFADLYNSYKISNPLEIEPVNEQAELLTYIDALCFATIDLGLYLDLHPDDKNILQLFNKYNEQKKQYEKEYESKFGPLLLSNSGKDFPWAWINMPWPWTNK